MKIIDCFTFYNEFDILYYRLSLLYDIVDYFIIVEANKTHTGKDKPYNFIENIEKYNKFMEKIIYVQVEDLDSNPYVNSDGNWNDGVWQNENKQRNYIDVGIRCVPDMRDDDIIIISDVDEIPNYNILLRFKVENVEVNQIDYVTLIQDLYYYSLTTKSKTQWDYAKLVSYKCYVEKLNRIPQKCRMPYHGKAILNGGWHLSYFGNPTFIQNKLQNFAHQEYNKEENTNLENIAEKLKNKLPLLPNQNIEYIPIENNKNLPPRYKEFLLQYI